MVIDLFNKEIYKTYKHIYGETTPHSNKKTRDF